MSLRRTFVPFTVAAVAAILGAAVGLTSASADDETVTLQDISFNPASVTINVGDTVTWTHNDEGQPHNVTGGPLDSGNFEVGESFQFTFDEAGTFDYACTIHPTMSGSVVVQEQATDDTPEPQATDTPAAQPGDGDNGDDAEDGDDGAGDGETPAATSSPGAPDSGTGNAGSGSSWGWIALAGVAAILAAAVGGGAWMRSRS